jgi:hypothetical protein
MGKLESLQEKSSAAADRMLKRLKKVIQSSGIVVDNNLHSDLLNIMQSNDKSIKDTYPAGTSFGRSS